MLEYTNPILFADYSDPDVIKVGEDYFMVSSSFNYVPGIPVLHSKNLVEWSFCGYVLTELPFKRYNKVVSGCGVWAVSIRFHNGYFYCVIPFPDEGIYVAKTTNPFNGWEKPYCLTTEKGWIDPCPIWTEKGAYLTFAFAKSRVGFNSKIAVIKVSENLDKLEEENYTVVYDGSNNNPTIEGPKFYKRGEYFYILAPAGGVKNGWQVALRSKSVYGPYESKIVLMQGDSSINGPHQGGLVSGEKGDYFLHFQHVEGYGRIVHLQPVTWLNDYPIMGEVKDENLAGVPVLKGNYPINIKTNYKIPTCFDFKKGEFLTWQTPCNLDKKWYYFSNGLVLNCIEHNENFLSFPATFCQKIAFENFKVETEIDLKNLTDGSQTGLIVLGKTYGLISCQNLLGKLTANLIIFDDNSEKVVESIEISDKVKLKLLGVRLNSGQLQITFMVNNKKFKTKFIATDGRWVGSHVGIFAKGKEEKNYATFSYFNQTKI